MPTENLAPPPRYDDPLWVPAEHRIAGIDRRTIRPALAVLALALFVSVVLPRVDGAVGYDDEIRAGDVIDLADEGRLTFVPAPGWNLEEGVRVGGTRSGTSGTSTTVLTAGDVLLAVEVAPFDGTPAALLTRVDELNDDLDDARGLGVSGDRFTLRTDAGAVGVAESFTGLKRQGTLAAFVVGLPGRTGRTASAGVTVLTAGSEGALATRRDDIDAMVRSIRVEETS
jgi:hypothetical protein